ncbi:DUF429 domain-containing protein [Enterovibrio baiacu]|uniref:DUF429 domain-containing protein n=1 Tax=Enterovibrio baiacu TaxID=2491023 RepID=UPI0010117CFD|nr:DUF429 domain-containing protein [Enterovibrio baiacu]MBE1275010.1 DUF429 domain-containing protein [Enterovibrio baiacu]
MKLLGIDLAWQGEKNTSALCFGTLHHQRLTVDTLIPAVLGINNIKTLIAQHPTTKGIAIDAPLIIPNKTGQRECEKALSKVYGARKASCHTSNQTLYPDALSVALSQHLYQSGYEHLGRDCWQIECYPHPAIIESFGLSERLLYKKGTVADKKTGQVHFADKLKALAHSSVLALDVPPAYAHVLNRDEIQQLKGQALKQNEDALDAIMCLYIAGLYASNPSMGVQYGNRESGYIWVPTTLCI